MFCILIITHSKSVQMVNTEHFSLFSKQGNFPVNRTDMWAFKHLILVQRNYCATQTTEQHLDNWLYIFKAPGQGVCDNANQIGAHFLNNFQFQIMRNRDAFAACLRRDIIQDTLPVNFTGLYQTFFLFITAEHHKTYNTPSTLPTHPTQQLQFLPSKF